jgi:hypothetical protein
VPLVVRACVEHLEWAGLSTVASYGQGGSALKVHANATIMFPFC